MGTFDKNANPDRRNDSCSDEFAVRMRKFTIGFCFAEIQNSHRRSTAQETHGLPGRRRARGHHEGQGQLLDGAQGLRGVRHTCFREAWRQSSVSAATVTAASWVFRARWLARIGRSSSRDRADSNFTTMYPTFACNHRFDKEVHNTGVPARSLFFAVPGNAVVRWQQCASVMWTNVQRSKIQKFACAVAVTACGEHRCPLK